MPLVSLDRISVAFGHTPLLDEAVVQIEPRERVCVIGRNGSGKSTLLQILSGERRPDGGSVWTQPGLKVARLEQDVPLSSDRSVFETVADGLGPTKELVTAYHRAATEVAERPTTAALDRLGRFQRELEERDGWRIEQRVETVLARLSLPSEALVDTLSGGWRRRVLLAQALVAEPDLLLLDEPTNHLDIDAIAWLEAFLADYAGAIVCVTHDRVFLQRLATRIVELDRGRLTSWPGDYATYVRRKEESLATQAVHEEKFDKRLAIEEAWLRQGIKARRTRNEGRVRALIGLRAERAARREQPGVARLRLTSADVSGRLVVEAEHVDKALGGRSIVRDFSVRIMRRDRVGIIGPNGAGKTTLLRLLIGELVPDAGEVRRGANVQEAYYDQQREQLDPDKTVFDTIGDGNDTVVVNGRSRHVNAYLRDFEFPPERAQSPVRALSGGERNRLLLARILARQANLLVLDEPTNDLDIETLELLESELVGWDGTLLLVSHDRAFLDNIVTSTLVLEGDGRVGEYVGGYEDWLRQRARIGPGRDPIAVQAVPRAAEPAARANAVQGAKAVVAGVPRKLSYKEQREYDGLPARIEALESEQRALTETVAAPEFYKEPASTIAETLARLETLDRTLAELYERWDALDSRPR